MYHKWEIFCRGKVPRFSRMAIELQNFYTHYFTKMVLFKCFKCVDSNEMKSIRLPAEIDVLSQAMLIKEANVAVCNTIKGQEKSQRISHVYCHPFKLASYVHVQQPNP